MMGGEAPETCWAKHKRQVINLWNCCILLVDLFESYDDARTCKRQKTQIVVGWDAKYLRRCPYFASYPRICFEILVEVGKLRLYRWWGICNSNIKSHKRPKCLGHKSATSRNFQFRCQHRSKAVQLRCSKVWSGGKLWFYILIIDISKWLTTTTTATTKDAGISRF